ncbi:MAG: hypothetical protein MI867_08150 [Pseudomonadales bacterium]|nr:hypothetical protein [Pseudomonadales bacterium]
MNKVEFAVNRATVAILSIFAGYVLLVILPTFLSGEAAGAYANIGQLFWVSAFIQLVSVSAVLLLRRKLFVVGIVCNLIALIPIASFFVESAP